MDDSLTKHSIYQLKQANRNADIPEDTPLWSDDKLGRKKTAERLVNMVAGQIGPLTIGLNGAWGEGKTFFLKRFQKTYESKGGCAVYFNAWQDDFLDDPLLSLLAQLKKAVGGLPQETLASSVKQAVLPVLKQAGVALFKSFVKNTAKIDIDAISAKELETKAEKLLDGYETASSSKDQLVAALKTLAKEVSDCSHMPLVVIVDELDRCRPTFAIETLERIKHLFAVAHIVFVLGIDREQLASSIRSVYGDIDAQGYLQRFIDLEFVLPRDTLFQFLQDRLEVSQIDQAIETIDCGSSRDTITSFFAAFCAIADAERLSLRAVEHAIRKFALVACAKDHQSHTWTIVTAFAIGLSLLPDKNLFNRFMNCECEPQEIVDAIFPEFDMDYSTINNAREKAIQYLYELYYHTFWDERTKQEFSAMLEQARQKEGATVDMKHLPALAAKSSPEDVYYFFKGVPYEGGFGVNLKTLLADLRDAMSSIVEFPPARKESGNA